MAITHFGRNQGDGNRSADQASDSDTSQAGGYSTSGAVSTPAIVSFPFTTEPIPRPRTPPREGIRTGEIVAHRIWRVREERYVMPVVLYHFDDHDPNEPVSIPDPKLEPMRLASFMTSQAWEPGFPMQGDIDDWNRDSGIAYGVYAAKKMDELLFTVVNLAHGGTNLALGTVDLWGDVDEHEKGYRAQFAQVRSIDALFGGCFDDYPRPELRVSPPPYQMVIGDRLGLPKNRQAMLAKLREIYGCS